MDAFEWGTLFFMLVSWWVNPFDTNGTSSKVMGKRYRNFKARTKIVPVWFLGPIWFVLYTLVAVSLWLYLNWSPTEDEDDSAHSFYGAIFGLMIGHYIFAKLWTMLFFTMKTYWVGALDAFLSFLSALAIGILLWIRNGWGSPVIVAGILFIPYVVWTAYVTILSLDIAIHNGSESFLARGMEKIETRKMLAQREEHEEEEELREERRGRDTRRRRSRSRPRRSDGVPGW